MGRKPKVKHFHHKIEALISNDQMEILRDYMAQRGFTIQAEAVRALIDALDEMPGQSLRGVVQRDYGLRTAH